MSGGGPRSNKEPLSRSGPGRTKNHCLDPKTPSRLGSQQHTVVRMKFDPEQWSAPCFQGPTPFSIMITIRIPIEFLHRGWHSRYERKSLDPILNGGSAKRQIHRNRTGHIIAKPHLHTIFSFTPTTPPQPNAGYLREDSKYLPGGGPPEDIGIPPLELLSSYKSRSIQKMKSPLLVIVVENKRTPKSSENLNSQSDNSQDHKNRLHVESQKVTLIHHRQ